MDKIFDSIYIGTTRIFLAIIISHPFDFLKTKIQSSSEKSTSSISLSIKIYNTYGIKGFFKGYLPSLYRSLFKETYRSPLRGFLDYKFENIFRSYNKSFTKTLTAISMAITDTVILSPIERVKVLVMTNNSEANPIKAFWRNKPKGLQLSHYLFKGLTVSLVRSILSWTSFLVCEEKIRHYYELRSKSLSLANRITIGVLSGIINGLITQPFDTIKTNIQKSTEQKDKLNSIYKMGLFLFQQNGIKGLYAGFNVRLFQYSIIGVFSSDIIQQVDKIWKINSENNIFYFFSYINFLMTFTYSYHLFLDIILRRS
jgi:hypothetical protein